MRGSAARHRTRTLPALLALTLTGLLGGCSSLPTPSWDPTDLMDFLDTKKPTPGVRKPVFPEGVPGLSQGVPPELVRGSPESQAMSAGGNVQAAAPVAEPPPQETRPPPAKRSRTATRRSSPQRQPQQHQQPVEVAPDDVNVGEEQGRAAPRQYQQQSAPPFPAPLPR